MKKNILLYFSLLLLSVPSNAQVQSSTLLPFSNIDPKPTALIVNPDDSGIQSDMANLPLTTSILDSNARLKPEIEVWPNPSSGDFNLKVDINPSEKYSLTLSNVLGQEVYSEQITNQATYNRHFNFNQFGKGVYYVRIVGQNDRRLQKIVIQ